MWVLFCSFIFIWYSISLHFIHRPPTNFINLSPLTCLGLVVTQFRAIRAYSELLVRNARDDLRPPGHCVPVSRGVTSDHHNYWGFQFLSVAAVTSSVPASQAGSTYIRSQYNLNPPPVSVSTGIRINAINVYLQFIKTIFVHKQKYL